MEKTKPSRGGRREGAGRPRCMTEKQNIVVWFLPETYEKLGRYAKVHGMTRTAVLEKLVKELQ